MNILSATTENKTFLIVDKITTTRHDGKVDRLYDLIHINSTSFTDKDIETLMVPHEENDRFRESTIPTADLHIHELRNIVNGEVINIMRSYHIIPQPALEKALDEELIEPKRRVTREIRGNEL